MDEYVIAIFLAALAGTTLSLGAWLVRMLKRDFVVIWNGGVFLRASSPVAYWFWAIYHVLGLTLVIVVAVAVTLYFVLGAIA